MAAGKRLAAVAAVALVLGGRPLAAQAPALGLGAAPVIGAGLRGTDVPEITLAEAIERANAVQPTVVQARGQIRNAEAQKRVTGLGAWLPNVNATSSGGYSFSEGLGRTDPITGEVLSGDTEQKSVSLGISGSLELFTGFRRGADNRAARAGIDAAEAAYVNAGFQQRLTTTNQFLTALAARQLVAVREASLRRADEQLKAAVARLRAGSATRSDSLRSLVQVGNAQVQLVTALSDLQGAEAQLARLVGAEGRVRAADDSAFYRVVTELDTVALRQQARSASPQVRSAEASAQQARAQLTSAKSAYWPTLTLSGNYNYAGSERLDYQLFNSRQATLALTWPLFNRFQRERTIDNQRTALENAEAAEADAIRQVDAQLSAQLGVLEATSLRIEIAQTNLAAANEDLRVQQERYRLGASTIIDVLTSQEALNQAEVDAVNARFDYLRAKAQIETLVGRTL